MRKCNDHIFTDDRLLEMQRDQYSHDLRNHFDILSLHKQDRLKHYGHHFAKYAGRIARGEVEEKSERATITDAYLVCLSAANTLHQKLEYRNAGKNNVRFLERFTDAQGRFNDACDKIDHLEPFVESARVSNADILNCLVDRIIEVGINIEASLMARRDHLRARQFFIR